LLEQAERHRDRWDALPAEVRTPGGLARVHGFFLSPSGDDLLLLGRRDALGPPLEIDDLIVAVRAVWKEGRAPTCSLDPDPEDIKANRAGPQKVRLIDVPRDCGFARTMLDADYAMKKV